MAEKEKEEKQTDEQLADKKRQDEMERDLKFMKGKFEMARHIYSPFMKLCEQLGGKVTDIHRLKEATTEIVGAMVKPLESGQTRAEMVKEALEKFSIGADEISSVKKLINNPNVDISTGLSDLVGFFGHKYAHKQPSANEQAFIEGLRTAQAGIGNAKKETKGTEEVTKGEKAEPSKESSDKREESKSKGAKASTGVQRGKTLGTGGFYKAMEEREFEKMTGFGQKDKDFEGKQDG